MTYRYIDIHCHPNLGGLKENQDEVIAKMRENGVLGIVVGVNLESSREAAALAQKHDHLFATVGLHPNYTQKEAFDRGAFAELLKQDKVVGVGECGVDYFRQSAGASDAPAEDWKEKQWEVFKQHVELAIEYDKPLMIHCRPSKGSMDAYEEVADYLESLPAVQRPSVAQEEGEEITGDVRRPLLRGNMHFFVGDLAVAKRFWALGFTTSFTGVLTFTNDYDEVVKEAPLDMLLSETDAPYAAPVPHRGEVNQPVYVTFVARKIAALKGESMETVQEAILENARRVFGLSCELHIAP